jgi:hypothetical protein
MAAGPLPHAGSYKNVTGVTFFAPRATYQNAWFLAEKGLLER